MKRLLMDVDGVVADFKGAVLDAIEKVTGRRYERSQVTEWSIEKSLGLDRDVWKVVVDEHICAPGFARELKAYEGAVEAVRQLAESFDLYFVTADFRSSPTWVYDRNRWLGRKFGSEQGQKVVHTSCKHLVAGDFLVDDKTSTIVEWQEAHPSSTAILWHQSYNIDDDWNPRVRSWPLLADILAP